jgi:L-histidine Nalpha-methyltransferase
MALVPIHFHPSCFPAAVSRRWHESLKNREMDHAFHYLTHRQAMKWLAVHEAYSPARTDEGCGQIYHQAFYHVAQALEHVDMAVIGLGCGGGHKEAQLLDLLEKAGRRPTFVACDVSSDLVLTTLERTSVSMRVRQQSPALVADLRQGKDLGPVWDRWTGRVPRIFTFFGMLPNFLPGEVLPVIAAWLRPGDVLLLGANLAPGPDYQAGCEKILPQYDNAPTREWLSVVLDDLGIPASAYQIHCDLAGHGGLKRIEVSAHFHRGVKVVLEEKTHLFEPGEKMRLFFSNRHTPALVAEAVISVRLKLGQGWITPSGEEGVWIVTR